MRHAKIALFAAMILAAALPCWAKADVNDNCDDRSLNIPESRDPKAISGPEQIQGPLLIDFTEPLVQWVKKRKIRFPWKEESHGRNPRQLLLDVPYDREQPIQGDAVALIKARTMEAN